MTLPTNLGRGQPGSLMLSHGFASHVQASNSLRLRSRSHFLLNVLRCRNQRPVIWCRSTFQQATMAEQVVKSHDAPIYNSCTQKLHQIVLEAAAGYGPVTFTFASSDAVPDRVKAYVDDLLKIIRNPTKSVHVIRPRSHGIPSARKKMMRRTLSRVCLLRSDSSNPSANDLILALQWTGYDRVFSTRCPSAALDAKDNPLLRDS